MCWYLLRRSAAGSSTSLQHHQVYGWRCRHSIGSHRPKRQHRYVRLSLRLVYNVLVFWFRPWEGGQQLGPDHPEGWQCRAPSAIAYGGKMPYTPTELSIEEIKELHRNYAQSATWAVEAGFEWIELHFAHGYLVSSRSSLYQITHKTVEKGASFFSPIANQRTDQYGGSLENRARFLLEAIDAVRAVLPDRIPLTMRLGSDE